MFGGIRVAETVIYSPSGDVPGEAFSEIITIKFNGGDLGVGANGVWNFTNLRLKEIGEYRAQLDVENVHLETVFMNVALAPSTN